MKYILVSLMSLFAAGIGIGVVILILRHTRFVSKYYALIQYLKTLCATINSARWGNLTTRLDKSPTPLTKDISKGLNSLLESISDRDKMILEYVEKEKENNALIEDFVAILTHDLKVPIIAQDNTLDLLLAGKFGELSQIQREVLENIKISNLDLKYLVETSLESHNYRKKGFVVNNVEFNLREFCDEIIQQVGHLITLHKKELRLFDELSNDLTVFTDKILLKRVVLNFILNSLSYSGSSKYIDLTLKNNEKEFSISVKDYGVGISKEDIDKIFNKYYSAPQAYSKASTGLGLYLSNKIALALGGKIEVDSKENQGAKFSIILQSK